MSARNRWLILTSVTVVVAVFLLYHPVLRHELTSDGYQWAKLAHEALDRPALLFADLDTFYRPASTWTLALDYGIWGTDPAGYHLTNLLLHAAAALGLALAAHRLGLSRVSATVVALFWATAPFTEEPAVWVAARFQDLLVIAWCGLIVAWPGSGEAWTRRRTLAVGAFVLLAAASKETWVATPVLAYALELHRTDRAWWRSIRPVVPIALLVAAYVLGYFLAFPSDKAYYRYDFATLAKVPHMLAAFLHLEELLPLAFSWTWSAVLAAAAVAAAALTGVRRGLHAATVGVALFAATVPTLFVQFLPTRHTAIPYAGFLLIVAALAEHFAPSVPQRWRRAATVGLGVFLSLILLGHVALVRADLTDFRRVSDATARVLDEARAIGSGLPLDRPIIVVRNENSTPLTEIALEPHGRLKIWYQRHDDAYGLVDTAALFEWVLDDSALFVDRVDDWESELAGVGGDLVVHDDGAFRRIPRPTADVAAAAARLRADGRRLQVIIARAR